MEDYKNISGILNINKPVGWTSFDVVQKIRRITGVRKVGHTGTLDPFATGVLVVCLGRATKMVSTLMNTTKLYRAVFHLGISTDTYDIEGKIIHSVPEVEPHGFTAVAPAPSSAKPAEAHPPTPDISSRNYGISRIDDTATADTLLRIHPRVYTRGFLRRRVKIDRQQINTAINDFIGDIEQIPPMYSAIKVKGRRLYELARQGKEITLSARKIKIYRIEILKWENPFLTLEIECSPGTYIRSLAYDLGQKLGCGAYVKELVRLRSGDFSLEEAVTLEEVKKAWTNRKLTKILFPLESIKNRYKLLEYL